MRRRYSRILAVLAVAAMGTIMENSCTIGNRPDENPECLLFCDKSAEKSQTPPLTDASLSLSQAASGKPA